MRVICIALAGLLLAACGGGELADVRGRRIEYKSPDSQGSNPLELPPDLIADLANTPADAASFSEYRVDSVQTPQTPEPAQISGDVVYRRQGRLRWLEVSRPPAEVWPAVRGFWNDLGFALEIDDPAVGVMETDWLQNRARIAGIGVTGILDRYLERFHDTGERDKFRTRIEPGARPGSSEIHISYRGVGELSVGRGEYRFLRLPQDPQLEIEILRRMMLALGEAEEAAGAAIAAEEQAEDELYQLSDTRLLLFESYDAAWRHIAQALDRAGFTVDDRDRTLGKYFIRYTGLEEETRLHNEESKSLFSTIAFWRKERIEARDLQIALTATGESGQTAVTVLDENEAEVDAAIAATILALLAENL